MERTSNKGRITNPAQAWAVAHREYFERLSADRVVDVDDAHALALDEDFERFPVDEGGPVVVATQAPGVDFIAALQSIDVPLALLNAAMLAAAKDDIRYYLNGVYIHAVDSELRIVSTDGHRMIVSRYVPEIGVRIPEWAVDGIILPGDKLREVLPVMAKNAMLSPHDTQVARLTIDHQPGAQHVTLKSVNEFASFRVVPVDGKFPDYQRVIGESGQAFVREAGEVMQANGINAAYLKDAGIIAAKLGSKAIHSFSGGEKATVFTFEGAPDTILIVMPIRTGEAVTEGVMKIVGADGMAGSIRALKAHVTRTLPLLESKSEREREAAQAKLDTWNARIAQLVAATASGPKRLAHQDAS